MTRTECLEITGLTKKQIATIKRWSWESQRSGKEFKLASCNTAEEVMAVLNKSVKAKEVNQEQSINLAALSIEQLESMLKEIPEVIQMKKDEKLSEIEAKIKELEELKAELAK